MNSDTKKTNPVENKTILIVDDSAINVELMKIFVHETGALALSASNGVECLNILKSHKVDMILMDLNMPKMNGLEATKAIRAQPRYKDIIIIGVIGYDNGEETNSCRLAGMNDAIPKFSFNPDKLIEVTNIFFNHKDISDNQNSISEYSEKSLVDINQFNEKPVMDFHKALKEFDNDSELLLSLIHNFIVTIQNQFENINKAFPKNDLIQIEFEAHSIKGGAANLCAYQLSDAAKELETACKAGQPAETILEKIIKLQKHILDFSNFISEKKTTISWKLAVN